jgi:hypothetical protein
MVIIFSLWAAASRCELMSTKEQGKKPNLHKLIEFLNSSNHSNLTLYSKFALACVCIKKNTSLWMVGKLWVLWKTEWWSERQNCVPESLSRSPSELILAAASSAVQHLLLHVISCSCNPFPNLGKLFLIFQLPLQLWWWLIHFLNPLTLFKTLIKPFFHSFIQEHQMGFLLSSGGWSFGCSRALMQV